MLEISLKDFLLHGGPILLPILACSVLASGLMLKKWAEFKNFSSEINSLKPQIFDLVRKNRIKNAIALCEENPSPFTNILKSGLLHFGATRAIIKEELELTASFETPHLEKGITALATIANITPLLGLIGTVMGMITIFYTIQTQNASLNPITPADLASGIWQSLICTMMGMIVAIPTFMAHNYFVSQANHLITELEQEAIELANLLTRLAESQINDLTQPSDN